MQFVVVSRDNWVRLVSESGLRLEEIAAATGKSYSTVYRYSNGSRRPSDEWITQVALILSEREGRVA